MAQDDALLSMSVRDFVAATADKTPTPGGGSVAGVVGALAAALGSMALAFTRGKKKYAQHEEFHARLQERLTRARDMFEALVADDAAAFTLYQSANQMPEGPSRLDAQKTALAAAIAVPRESAALALALLKDLAALADKCNPYLISDLTAAAALAVATLKLSDYNTRINARSLPPEQADPLAEASRADVRKGDALLAEIERATAELFA